MNPKILPHSFVGTTEINIEIRDFQRPFYEWGLQCENPVLTLGPGPLVLENIFIYTGPKLSISEVHTHQGPDLSPGLSLAVCVGGACMPGWDLPPVRFLWESSPL